MFEIYRGRGKIGKLIRGRDIDFYGCYYDNASLEKVIGIQNIAYRFAANVISSDLEKVSYTVTLLVPKKEMSIRELISMVKGMDIDKVRQGIDGVQKAIGLIQDLGVGNKNSITNNYQARPIYRHFDD